jgi:hypothetical protein
MLLLVPLGFGNYVVNLQNSRVFGDALMVSLWPHDRKRYNGDRSILV